MFSSQLLTEYTTACRDSSAQNIANGKIKMNYYYNQLLAETDNYTMEKTRYFNLKANQRGYLLMPDYMRIKSIRVYIAPVWYPLDEEAGLDKWQDRIAVSYTQTIPTKFHIFNESGNMHFELDPIPALDVANGIEVVYEGYQDPLYFPTDASLPVGVTNASAQITSSAQFSAAMVGMFLQVTNGKYFYDINSYTDASHMALVNYFQETTNASAAVTIGEAPRLPIEYHLSPVWPAVADYYLPVNWRKQQDYLIKYNTDLASMKKKYQNKSKGQVTPGTPVSVHSSSVPRNYPKAALTNRP